MAKNIEHYRKTVDILYKAYFHDTLQHGDCRRCAVGNIVAGSGVLVSDGTTSCNNYYNNASWRLLFYTDDGYQTKIDTCDNQENVEKAIATTGYTINELAKVEFAFETAPHGFNDQDHMFNGLVAVLDVLKQIHEIEDNQPEVERFRVHKLSKV